VIERSDLASLLGVSYTDDQLDAITAPPAPLLIVAGAGSGKTAVMAARVVWLVATEQATPEQVLGLTFTNKAAASLSARVARALEDARLVDSVDPGPLVSTYHSFAGRLVSDHGLRVGVEPHVRVITDAARAQLALLTLRRTTLPLRALTGRPANHVGKLLKLDDALVEQGLSVAELATFDLELIASIDAESKPTKVVLDAREAALQRLELGALVDEFRLAKRDRDLIDFADQIRLALDIVTSQPGVVADLRAQFGAVLLDEYQDTSVAQRLLLATAFGDGHNVTAVGDPLQAIYGWRGASVDNIDSFPVHFPSSTGAPALQLSLAANMRSGSHILDAANDVAAPLRSTHTVVRPLTPGNPARGTGGIRLALLPQWSDELEWIADRICEQLDAGTPPEDIAVLTRRGSELADVDAVLAGRGVPTSVADLAGLLAVPEVVDIVSTLEVLADPTANTALLRLLTGPRWALGHRDLAFLARRARELAAAHRLGVPDDATLSERIAAHIATDPVDVVALIDAVEDPGDAPISPAAAQRCAQFVRELRLLRTLSDEQLGDLVLRVATITGLDVELAASPTLTTRNRSAVLQAFIDLAANFASFDGDASLAAFLAWLQAGDDLSSPPQLSIPPAPGAVALLTVHRAKGLEWPVVVLPAVTEEVFPSGRARPRHTKNPTVVPHALRADGAALPVDPDNTKAEHERFERDLKAFVRLEELRLGYVACTRAERLLIASGHWWGPTQQTRRGPSEILTHLHDAAVAGAGVVDTWEPEPDEDDTNPALSDVVAVPYLTATESPEGVRRRHLARLVEQSLQAPVSDADLAAVDATLTDVERDFFASWDDDAKRVVAAQLADRHPVRHVGLPPSLTASHIQRLAADPDEFARVLARPVPQAPRPAAWRGSELHRAIERHFGVAALLDLDDLSGAGDPDIADADITGMVGAFTSSPWANRAPRAIEWPFALSLGGRLVRGRVDAVFPWSAVPVSEVPALGEVPPDTSAGVVLVDWKTGRPGSGDPLQLAVYRVAWALAHAVDLSLVRACFVHWPSGVVVAPTDLADPSELAALLAPSAAVGNDQ